MNHIPSSGVVMGAPRATRPPQPALPLQIIRALALICIALATGRAQLLRSLEPYPPVAALSPLHLAREPVIVPSVVLRSLLDPPLFPLVKTVALGALIVIAVELGGALVSALCSSLTTRRATRHMTTLRIRPAQSIAGDAGPAARPGSLLRLIHAGLATGPFARQASWCTLLISGAPDLPAELGILIAGAPGDQRRITAALADAVRSTAPAALIAEASDPLRDMVVAGHWIAWRRFGLALPPAYPLHAPVDGTDPALAGVLLAAIRPRGSVIHTEIQVAIRPQGGNAGWSLGRGWRARATALKLALEQRQDYALTSDIAAIETKLADAAFDVTITAAAIAADASDALAALDAIADALGALQQRTASRLQRLEPIGRVQMHRIGGIAPERVIEALRAPCSAPPPALLLPRQPWRGPESLTAGELGYLWSVPSGPLSDLVRRDPCRRIAAPPHAFCAGDPERIMLGRAVRSDGRWDPVGPALRDLRQILHLTAGMGAGKSRLLANLCQQLIPHGFMLIDGKGDDRGGSLVDTVRRLIPVADEARLVILDPLDTAWPVGLNPLAGADLSQPGGVDLALGQTLATFARIDPDTWGHAPGMQQFARMATLLVLEGEVRPTLAHIKQALLDEGYRDGLLRLASNIEVASFWREVYPRLGDGQRASCDALLRRFDALLTAETTRYLVAQAEPTLNLAQAIADRMIVLAPLPDISLGGLAGAVGTLILQAFVRAAFARGGGDQGRHDYPLVVDELQVLIGNGDAGDMATAITRLRSLGVPTIYAHQALAQLGDLRDLMLINAGSRILLQTQEPDAGVYARLYSASGLSAADLSSQAPDEHQYAVLRCRGVAAGPFSMQPLPWPEFQDSALPPYTGPAWYEILPHDDDPADRYIVQAVYGTGNTARVAAELARLDALDWRRLLRRWECIRQQQRSFIVAHPGCIANRLERQRWLSRLLAGRPQVLAAAEYLRERSRRPHQDAQKEG